MRNISLGAAKKNVDTDGLEGALVKAKDEARRAGNELAAVKAALDKAQAAAGGAGVAGKGQSEALKREVAALRRDASVRDEEIERL